MEIELKEFDVWELKGKRAYANSAGVLNVEFRDRKGRTTAGLSISREGLEKLRNDIEYILESTKDVTGKAD